MECLKASCFLPGLAGGRPVEIRSKDLGERGKENAGGHLPEASAASLMVDALIFEPIPYRSALADGCTHVLVLRTWPDEKPLPQSFMRIFERILVPKCLKDFPGVLNFLFQDKHARLYAEDILRLNQVFLWQQRGC